MRRALLENKETLLIICSFLHSTIGRNINSRWTHHWLDTVERDVVLDQRERYQVLPGELLLPHAAILGTLSNTERFLPWEAQALSISFSAQLFSQSFLSSISSIPHTHLPVQRCFYPPSCYFASPLVSQSSSISSWFAHCTRKHNREIAAAHPYTGNRSSQD